VVRPCDHKTLARDGRTTARSGITEEWFRRWVPGYPQNGEFIPKEEVIQPGRSSGGVSLLGSLKECPNCHRPMEPGYLWGVRGTRWTPARQGKQGWEFSNWQPNEPLYHERKLPLFYRCASCGIYWLARSVS
jgi:hypothetical protein